MRSLSQNKHSYSQDLKHVPPKFIASILAINEAFLQITSFPNQSLSTNQTRVGVLCVVTYVTVNEYKN
jgi:hypothetical protein